jgi:hypothetical protein
VLKRTVPAKSNSDGKKPRGIGRLILTTHLYPRPGRRLSPSPPLATPFPTQFPVWPRPCSSNDKWWLKARIPGRLPSGFSFSTSSRCSLFAHPTSALTSVPSDPHAQERDGTRSSGSFIKVARSHLFDCGPLTCPAPFLFPY